MALSFFGGANHAKYFDIRLNDNYIVFRGGPQEAASAHLKGTLVLCLTEPLSIKHLKLHLRGMSRVCWSYSASYNSSHSGSGSSRKTHGEQVFYQKTWKFRDAGRGKTEILPPDNYEFPFDVVLEGSLPESVEGLAETWVTYRFKAEIGRKYAKDIVMRKPLRIIRTLPPAALELSHAMSVENVWPNKIEYLISTPSKAVIFGTSLRVDFKLIPLLKGLRIGEINSHMVEHHEVAVNHELSTAPGRNVFRISRTVAEDTVQLGDDDNLEIIDEVAEGHRFSRYLELPKTLTRCLQDAETRGIKVRHKLKFRIQLLNPDGHVSELRATLPVCIFISPNMPIDDNNNLVDQSPVSAQRAVEELAQHAPPVYGEHQFDQLYSEVDPSGYLTPGPTSGAATPFGGLSRNVSVENLASMNALAGADISPSALHNRLSNLHAMRSGRPSPERHESLPSRGPGFSNHFGESFSLSRRSSDEHDHAPSGTVTPRQPQSTEVESLSRVPSYTTAVRSTIRPRDSNLPDYQAVVTGDIPTPEAPQSPQQAHIRTRRPAEALDHPSFIQPRGLGPGEDGERTLRLLQARAR